jgi:DNA-binding PadR family transcriptional regulator
MHSSTRRRRGHSEWFAVTGAGPGSHRRGPRRRHGHWGFAGFPGYRGPRARRGDIRTALLALLGEEPRNGYQLMQEIEQRSEGVWRPSPGSVYPALQQLEDEGLVATSEREGRRGYELTDAGRAELGTLGEGPAPWDAVKDDLGTGPRQLMRLVHEIGMAAAQLVHAGDDAQLDQAQGVLREARRALYRILAEDPPSGGPPGPEPRDSG